MRALVVYESMFGNTRDVAAAITEGLAQHSQVELCEVGSAPAALPDRLDLLVVGAPTHALGMSRPRTRSQAAEQGSGELVSKGIGVREWLAGLSRGANLTPTAAFGTKMSRPSWLPGSAARGIAKRLRRLGHPAAAPPRSFYVVDVSGPLAEGELQQAQQWGDLLGRTRAAALG